MSTTGSTDRFVLDGSVTLAWLFQDEKDPYADAIVGKLLTWTAEDKINDWVKKFAEAMK